MKLLPLLSLCLLLSCNAEKDTAVIRSSGDSTETAPPAGPPPAAAYGRVEGIYAGDFDGADIRIVLRHLTGRNAVGYNLHRGLRRNINGTMQAAGGTYSFALSEPGDHPYDGVFRFTIDTATRRLQGEWTPQRTGTGLRAKKLDLQYAGTDSTSGTDRTEFMDTTGTFAFYPSGLVQYEFYPLGKNAAKQLRIIRGNWRQTERKIAIEWEDNTAFPGKKSSFDMTGEGDLFANPWELTLEGGGRQLYTGEF